VPTYEKIFDIINWPHKALGHAPTKDMKAAEEETELEGHEKMADELAACTAPTKDTKVGEEVTLMSEVTKVRVEDYGSQSTLCR
jgi:hypothetical protein